VFIFASPRINRTTPASRGQLGWLVHECGTDFGRV
jgi:hypothetical protein